MRKTSTRGRERQGLSKPSAAGCWSPEPVPGHSLTDLRCVAARLPDPPAVRPSDQRPERTHALRDESATTRNLAVTASSCTAVSGGRRTRPQDCDDVPPRLATRASSTGGAPMAVVDSRSRPHGHLASARGDLAGPWQADQVPPSPGCHRSAWPAPPLTQRIGFRWVAGVHWLSSPRLRRTLGEGKAGTDRRLW